MQDEVKRDGSPHRLYFVEAAAYFVYLFGFDFLPLESYLSFAWIRSVHLVCSCNMGKKDEN